MEVVGELHLPFVIVSLIYKLALFQFFLEGLKILLNIN